MLAAILLAAGGSSRLGSPKQLIDIDGEPLVRRVARQLIELDAGPVGVVVGSAAEEVTAALEGLPLVTIANLSWALGIGASIRTGINWADAIAAGAAMICLCDQPDIDSPHLRQLLDKRGDADVVATRYADNLGVPAVFARVTFPRLANLPDDRGAKAILNDPHLCVIAVANEAAAIDLDTAGDVERWRTRRTRQRGAGFNP